MIRTARLTELKRILEIYNFARSYMARSGNPTQWESGYPFPALLEQDIASGQLYVICGKADVPHAVFAFLLGPDPTYTAIDGAWCNDEPYGTIHRLASDGTIHHVFETCLIFCQNLCPNIRADTHENNRTMRHLLERHGFVRCGWVNLGREEGDDLRIAYQRTEIHKIFDRREET